MVRICSRATGVPRANPIRQGKDWRHRNMSLPWLGLALIIRLLRELHLRLGSSVESTGPVRAFVRCPEGIRKPGRGQEFAPKAFAARDRERGSTPVQTGS